MLKNLVTLVTGGASGLGRMTATRFAKRNSQVVVCDLSTSNGESVAKEIGANVRFIPADVRSRTDVENLIEQISNSYGQLDVVVNCAGIRKIHQSYDFVMKKPDLDTIEEVWKTNVLGTYYVSCLAAGLIAKNQLDQNQLRGVIINTSGLEAKEPGFGHTSIAAAAGAITSMTQSLANDFNERGIRVVNVSPGFFDTPAMSYISQENITNTISGNLFSPKRLGDPSEFAHIVTSIVANPYINATTIEITGGAERCV